MGQTLGTSNTQGLPLSFRFRYNGTDVTWGQPYRVNDFSNSAEVVDGRYRISDLDAVFMDQGGSIFRSSFGDGTMGFGSTLEVIAYLGGTMEYQTQGLATVFKSIGTQGAHVATVHTGRVHGISYKNRLLRIRSKTKMGLLKDMKWQYPVTELSGSYQVRGSYLFVNRDERDQFPGSSFYEFGNARTQWRANAYTLASTYSPVGTFSRLSAEWPAMAGRGTGTVGSGYYYPGTNSSGTNFYDACEMIQLQGSYLKTFHGTITDDETAIEFGYEDRDAAEAAKTGAGNPFAYVLNKTRYSASGTDLPHHRVYFAGQIRILGNPKQCYQDIFAGAMVTPYFFTSDLEESTTNASGSITTYSNYDLVIGPNEVTSEEPIKNIKTFFSSTQSIFSVNASNKFEWRAYGPKNLQESPPELSYQILESSFENLEEDLYNRFVVKYQWNWQINKYATQQEIKTSKWRADYDLPMTIECKWIQNVNEVNILLGRLRERFNTTVPHIKFKTSLNEIGYDIGTLIQVTDLQSGLGTKMVQVTGFSKNWGDRTIEFTGLDGEALWYRKGYGMWEDTNNLTAIVSGTSTSGWSGSGTVDNINSAFYGTAFHWF